MLNAEIKRRIDAARAYSDKYADIIESGGSLIDARITANKAIYARRVSRTLTSADF